MIFYDTLFPSETLIFLSTIILYFFRFENKVYNFKHKLHKILNTVNAIYFVSFLVLRGGKEIKIYKVVNIFWPYELVLLIKETTL